MKKLCIFVASIVAGLVLRIVALALSFWDMSQLSELNVGALNVVLAAIQGIAALILFLLLGIFIMRRFPKRDLMMSALIMAAYTVLCFGLKIAIIQFSPLPHIIYTINFFLQIPIEIYKTMIQFIQTLCLSRVPIGIINAFPYVNIFLPFAFVLFGEKAKQSNSHE